MLYQDNLEALELRLSDPADTLLASLRFQPLNGNCHNANIWMIKKGELQLDGFADRKKSATWIQVQTQEGLMTLLCRRRRDSYAVEDSLQGKMSKKPFEHRMEVHGISC